MPVLRIQTLAHRGLVIAYALALASGLTHASSQRAAQRETALQLEQNGDTAQAETVWKEILRVHPDSSEAYAHIGLLEARQEHFTQAVPYYRKALALDPSMPGMRMNMGLSQFKGGDFKGAVQTFEILLKKQAPSSPEAVRLDTLLGLAHYGLAEYALAIPYLKRAVAADPQNLPFRMALAQSCLWSKHYQCVLDVYKEIVSLNAESAEADMLAGQAYDEMKNEAGAMEQFRAAVKADPTMPNVHFGYGYLLWRQMKLEEAEQEFRAELANTPGHAQAMTFLGDAEIHLGHSDAAVPLLQEAVRIDPSIPLAHLDLGIVYADRGQNEDALRELRTAASLSPNDSNIHWRLGRFYQSIGRKTDAKVEFDKTRTLQRAENASVFEKLHQAQAKPREDQADIPQIR